MQTYRGSCHCGSVRSEADLELDHVRVCDCSMCRKRGGLLHRVDDSRFRLHTPLRELSLYQWNTMTARDYFCPVCGSQPFRRPRTAPESWSVNVRCLDGVDVESLRVEHVRGSKLS